MNTYSNQIETHREEIKAILSGEDKRMLIIVGPCSAWPAEKVIEYAKKLKPLADELEDKLKIIMRVFTQKPRTIAGWMGPLWQPDPKLPADIKKGEKYARELMLKIAEIGLPIADEALFLQSTETFLDLLSWTVIGARSTEDQEHRIFASKLMIPTGMKNPTSGSVRIGVNSVTAAQHSHPAISEGKQIQTKGNPYAHLVLRGGGKGPNYSLDRLQRAAELLKEKQIKNPAVLVDTSHENCRINGVKNPKFQINVVSDVLQSLKTNPELKDTIKGFMIESFLEENDSITDPCLPWNDTLSLLKEIAKQ
ncbi:3-deoxy-7-phosphoheptulonate synthase [Candidatus Peregrinibacteria bacterium]|jgi:3-deoxy-7-phosphoheptulonate synthase|nr:3-deoxy-7-phosphoheptulonate synthase [Candidatus Peregrinibacteria bacterium]MBT4631475.1 3-deoxy-7-phosphoheptulonate synthase [Candidatus Peregrinibacteria bacterium]MBT5516581.1 3-deoxy-7-phosphoheptulonate synthase [Candidatus Peregrinibacteria bacterium]MBT5823864.1 3-deoxy-7-phosphoheptulonate synthase [Candidatus Peregrinibacteria bacterium]